MEILLFIIAILLVVVIWLLVSLTSEKKIKRDLLKINQKLSSDNAFLEAEHLKFQLQPHTLNNILAHLQVMAGRLNRGLNSLSNTLEYILYNGKHHFVTISDEIQFIEEYLKLNELFIPEIDAIRLDFSEVNQKSKYYSSACIPHLITAYFVENALKHGHIVERESLKIYLKLTDNEFHLKVVNKMKERPVSSKGGLGLSNMRRRLDLLVNNKYEFNTFVHGDEFQSLLIIKFL